MTEPVLEVRGLNEIIQRMQKFPDKLSKVLETGMKASLLALWEKVPPYPNPPQDSTYRRTGTLGRTLGSSEGGGKGSATPSIYETRKLGNGMEGKFGTNLDYAPYVIGEQSQARHMRHWWKTSKIAKDAKSKIEQVWKGIAKSLADFLDGKGLL